jgi:site-specific DNA-methyltransferase (adenine-specific)
VQGCLTAPPSAESRAPDYGGVPAGQYVVWFMEIAARLWEVLGDDGSFLLNLKEHSEGIRREVYVHALVVALAQAGWVYLDEFCWERPGIPGDAVARGKLKDMWKPVFWFAKQVRPAYHPERVRHRSDKAILETGKGEGWAYPGNRLPILGAAESLGHPAAWPIELPRFFLEVYSDPGEWWVDPFGGSGTTMIACAEMDRKCWMMERSPQYTAITLQRYKDEFGVEPVLLSPSSAR